MTGDPLAVILSTEKYVPGVQSPPPFGGQGSFLSAWKAVAMFVTLSTYQARLGEEDAIIALHEDWQRQQQPKVKGYLSGELLRNVEASREFIGIMRFENRASAQACASDPEQQVWARRIASLVENVPQLTGYRQEWP